MKRLICTSLVLVCVAVANAQMPQPGTVVRPARAGDGTVVVPDDFLRSWDPVTIFFDRDVGKSPGTAADDPGDLVTIQPPHPGAYTWIDSRTLQFRPADAWSPLERYTLSVAGRDFVLHSLMSAPISTIPGAGSDGLDEVDAVTLEFADELDPEDLERMVSIEVRPLPGTAAGRARWFNSEDFTIKTMDRNVPTDPAKYILILDSPIPYASRAIVHFRLSLDDDAEQSFAEFEFSTAQPFRVLNLGSRSTRYPVTPEGVHYEDDQAIDGGSDPPLVIVEFSSTPSEISPLQARRLLRFTPSVEHLDYRLAGRQLEVSGDFKWDTLYHIRLDSSPIADRRGRVLTMEAPSSLSLFFPRRPAYLKWGNSQGVIERFGPKMLPVEGRGHERFDLRLFTIDPLDRAFWPFPDRPIVVDEAKRPPGPGETPPSYNELRHIPEHFLRNHLTALPSPPVSEIVTLPLKRDGRSSHFGLDIADQLAAISTSDRPGHYLVGLRALDAGSERSWMRVQVTDLCLTTVEEAHEVRFAVTSLSSGEAVAGASVRVEVDKWNSDNSGWRTMVRGITDARGLFRWQPGGCGHCQVLRIIVEKGDDVLVLNPSRAPDGFSDGQWSPSSENWLQWTTSSHSWRGAQPEEVSHVFTDRPIYRPDEAVYIKGYIRERHAGILEDLPLSKTFVVIDGPGDLEWRYPVELSELGSFSWTFEADDRPTGRYSAWLEGWRSDQRRTFVSESVPFQLEAYRLPRFEVSVHAPEKINLDRPVDVTMTAEYYAGGRVAERPLHWRVTQFPYTWIPPGYEGFLFSSDGRFSANQRFESTAAIDRQELTDEEGSGVITIDPTIEATAQPRSYVVEATVTGSDDQTVSASRRIVALPPFVLGLKIDRFIKEAAQIRPEILVLGLDEQPMAGLDMVLRLKNRQWHSYLQASDFTDGEARYITDVVDEVVLERELVSTAEIMELELPLSRAGVYVLELEARDRVGRTQVVSVDFYAGGAEAVSWSKPSAGTLAVNTDRSSYEPGDTVNFVLESPYQTARALVVIEAPEGNRYEWVGITKGQGTFSLDIKATWVPRIPVHFLLMRGRVVGTQPIPGSVTDLGKPSTLAATSWVAVEPVDNRVEVDLEHPSRALPGTEIDVTIRLSDPAGNPLAGEVTLWLVDQAVLALGREQRLDPLPDFITPVYSYLEFRDTRSMPFGWLPFSENPGGGEGERSAKSILDRATVRRNFQPVPFYDPRIMVGENGEITVRVQLPDNLTNFKLRAKAVSGLQRFGFATGELSIRLPVIVQPALPRFVRPGDSFTAAAIGRVVEGEGGPGRVEIAVEGVRLEDAPEQDVDWVPNRPQRFDFKVDVPTPEYGESGAPPERDAIFKVGVSRRSDGAMDAFEVRLPIVEDRRAKSIEKITTLEPGASVALPEVEGEARPGTIRRSILVSTQPALVRMAAGLSYLMEYPHHCTEQRLSRARSYLALSSLRDQLHLLENPDQLDRAVADVLDWLPHVVDAHGLVAFWPGSRGYVGLTAWTLDFLVEARTAGYQIDGKLEAEIVRSLEKSLRSDYTRFIDGASFSERAWALKALARAGRFNQAYASELARKARYLNLEATAAVLQSFMGNAAEPAVVEELTDRMWNGVVIALYHGSETYRGLQDREGPFQELILPSESRTLAEVVRALALVGDRDERLQVLIDGLVRLGRGDGWGSTNANSAALLALSEVMDEGTVEFEERMLSWTSEGGQREFSLRSEQPTVFLSETSASAATVQLEANASTEPPAVMRAECSWIPAEPATMIAAEASGFVVSRELLLYPSASAPAERFALESPGTVFEFTVGDVVEDHVQLVNPADRHYVAVVVPLAAGMEPLNPRLATAGPEATPQGSLTRAPAYAAFMDDHVAFYYDSLPKGTYDFYFRSRAMIPGVFAQPPAAAEMMYDLATRGNGNGATIAIVKAPETQ